MKRRLNIRLIICIVSMAGVLGAGVLRLHAFQVRRHVGALLARADRAKTQGDLSTAEESLRLFLGYQPHHATALAKYGMILTILARTVDDRIRASQTLEQALRLDPNRGDIRRRLIDLALSLKWYGIARVQLEVLLADGRPADPGGAEPKPEDSARSELEYLLGVCLEGLRDDASAALHYRKAITRAPHRIDSYVRLAALLRDRLHDKSGADRVMDAREIKDGLIAANGHSSRALLERGRYRRKYQIEGADADVARALELAPEDGEVLVAAAALAVDRGDLDRARRHLALGIDHQPQNWRISVALARLERKTGHPEKAQACLRRAIDASADPEGRGQLLWLLADSLIDAGNTTEATEVMEHLDQARVRPELLKYLGARILVREQRWSEAVRELEAAYPLLEVELELAYQANLLLGRCHEQLGDLDQRYLCLRRAVDLDPSRLEGRLRLAATIEAKGKLDQAVGEYRRMIDQAPVAGMVLARLLIHRNLRRPVGERDWQEVEQILGQTGRALPGSTGVTILRAEALVAQGQPQRAWELLAKARSEQPDRVELWTALAELADRHETPETAVSILQEAERRLGHRVELSLARIQHWASRGGPERSQALAEREREVGGATGGDQELLLRGLADAYLRIGDPAGASRVVSQLVRRRPEDLGLRFSQFELAAQIGDETTMGQVLGAIQTLEDDPRTPAEKEGSLWRYAKARSLLVSAQRRGRDPRRRERLDEARLLLTEAGSRRPSWPLVPLCAAEIEDFAGNPGRAINSYLAAIELGMTRSAVIRRAVQLLFDLRRFEQADHLIRRMQEQGLGTGDAPLQRLAAEVSLRVNDPARALELARQSTPADSRDYRDQLWLGQISWAAGDRATAEPALRRAVDLAGAAPEAWVTLVQFLVRTGRRDEAKLVIEQARRQLSGEQAASALARCYAELGEVDQARAQFRTALAARPQDVAMLRGAAALTLAVGQTAEAEADLKQIIDLQEKAPEDAAWARRLLATVLASTGDYRKSVQALELLGLADEGASYMPADEEPVEQLRTQAKVLALRNHRVARRAAIRILRHLVERGLPTPDDSYLLAQLAEADGQWFLAHRQIDNLLASAGNNTLYLAYAARSLLRHDLIDEAQPWLEKLEKLAPQSAAAIELKARALKQKGQVGEAVALLRSYVQGKPDQVGGAAALLEELGAMPAAEDLYRQFASRSGQPRALLSWAAFLGRRDRLAEALDLCETAWSSCPPEDVAATTALILYSAPVDPQPCRRAAAALERELEKTPRNAGLLFHLANIESLQGHYRQAEELYRRAHACDPEKSGPLANLAWLLARRDGRGAEALDLLAQAMQRDGPAPDLLETRGVIYLVVGRSDLAIKDLEDAVAVSPSALKYVHLAQAYLVAGRRNDADAALRNARAAGLRVEQLTPLERESSERLLKELTPP